jgi:lipoate-protein ligase A
MKNTFVELNGGVAGDITEAEYQAAAALVEAKYGTAEWLCKLP